MSKRPAVRNVVVAAVAAGALSLMSLLGGAAHAAEPYLELRLSNAMISNWSTSSDAEVSDLQIADGAEPSASGYNTWRTNFGRTD
jgi:hypothetical protein